ncbi:hypothetical protein P691DRAFT_775369, partial [Macrolepiota fuliginosa MF-IS2]
DTTVPSPQHIHEREPSHRLQSPPPPPLHPLNHHDLTSLYTQIDKLKPDVRFIQQLQSVSPDNSWLDEGVIARLRNPDEKGLIDSLAPDIQHGFENLINLRNHALSTYNSLWTTYLRRHPNETFSTLHKAREFIEQETIDHRIRSISATHRIFIPTRFTFPPPTLCPHKYDWYGIPHFSIVTF